MSITSVSSADTLSTIKSYLEDSSSTSSADIEELEEKLEEAYAKAAQEAATSSSSTTSSATKLYANLSASAENTQDLIETLQEAAESGDSTAIAAALSDFATSYNSMVGYLKDVGSAECVAMIGAFTSYFSDNEDALESIGITFSSSGKITVDSEALAAADSEEVAKLLGSSSSLMQNMKKMTDATVEVATLKVSADQALSTLYGSAGVINEYTLTASFLDMMS
ncbi:MAG: hypothetical protein K5840_02360 [Eubacterium sp.]|nr:hypothetical protein [Eubacterium sp.]